MIHTATLGELRNRDDLAHVQARHIGYWAGLGWGAVDDFCGEPDGLEVEWRVVPCPQCDGGEP